MTSPTPLRRLLIIAVGTLSIATLTTSPASADNAVVCRFSDPRLAEISGMTSSPSHPGVMWMHNDSSGGPRIYAVDAATCEVLATVTIEGMDARDIEAISSGVDDKGAPVLWIGDIGDNLESWSDVRISRIDEPEIRDATVPSRSFSLSYADGPVNAEGLLAQPSEPRLWVVSKAAASSAAIWALPTPLVDGMTARRVSPAPGLVTDGAFSADGSRFVLRGYLDAVIYAGLPGRSKEIVTVALPLQPQGEAVAWTPDGTALLVASERDDRLIRVALPEEAWADSARTTSPTPMPSPTSSPAPPPDGDSSADGGLAAVIAVIAGGLAIGVLIGLVLQRRQMRGRHRSRQHDGEGKEQ